MNQSIVDIPECGSRNKYNLQQLIDLPAGKAIKMELAGDTEVRTARGCVWNFCKRHELNGRTHSVRNNGNYILYAWLI